MKLDHKKLIKRVAVWLMTVIVAINYSVTIALAAEGIGQEELPERDASGAAEVAAVKVSVNPDAVVDAAIAQMNSGVRFVGGMLPVGAVTVDEIPVTASITLSVDEEAFAAKCAALQAAQFDPAGVFDSGYRSALRQDEATSFIWQEAAAMVDGIAILNGSERLVDLIVEAVQTGEEVAVAPENAALVEGVPLEAEVSGQPEASAEPEDEPSEDQSDGGAPETEDGESSQPDAGSDAEGQEPSDDAAGEPSDEDAPQGPPEDGGPEAEPEPDAVPDEPAVDEGGDSEPEDGESPLDKSDHADSRDEEPDNEDGGSEETDEQESGETGEGSVEANASRGETAVFYETAEADVDFSIPEAPEQEEPQDPQPQEEPSGDAPHAEPDSDGSHDADTEPGNGEDSETGETVELPEEAIAHSEGTVIVSNTRPMGGVMMAFWAAAPTGFSGNNITIGGNLTSSQGDGLNAIFFWAYKNPKPGDGGRDLAEYVPIPDGYALKGLTGKDGWSGQKVITATSDTVTMPLLRNSKKASYTFYLYQIPPSGYAPHNEAIGTLTVLNGVSTFAPASCLSELGNGNYEISYEGAGDKYRQYVSTTGGPKNDIMYVEGKPVYCFNYEYLRPYRTEHTIVSPVRYIKTMPNKSEEVNQSVKRVLQYAYPGNHLALNEETSNYYLQTQVVIWQYTDFLDHREPLAGTPLQQKILDAVKSGDPTYSDQEADATLSVKLPDEGTVRLYYDAEQGKYVSGPIGIEGQFDKCIFELPKGVEMRPGSLGGTPTTVISEPGTVYLVSENPTVNADSITVRAVKAWEREIGEVLFYEPVNSVMTQSASALYTEKFQSLIGYSETADVDQKESSFPIKTKDTPSDPRASLTLKKIAAEKNEDGAEKLLAGAAFTLEKYENGAWSLVGDPLTTPETGLVTAADLSLNMPYRLTETVSPEGYGKLESPVLFMLAEENGVKAVYQVTSAMTRGEPWATEGQGVTAVGLTMTVPNHKLQEIKQTLTLKKIAAEKNEDGTEKSLAGAVFTLEKYENGAWSLVGNPLTTPETGLVTAADLSLNVPYRLTETASPEGYGMLESPVLFMLAEENGVGGIYQVTSAMTRGEPWATEGQGVTAVGLTMTIPNEKNQEIQRTLKLHLDHLVQAGYDPAYNQLVSGTDFRFALVKDGAVVATGTSHGQNENVSWSTGGDIAFRSTGSDTVDITEGVYYLFGYDVEQPFQRVTHVYQEARDAQGGAYDPTFAGTADAGNGELREAASLVGGTPFMGVKITVTDADMTAFNGGTLYYHAESNLPMGRLTVTKTYYNRTYRNAGDEFRFEIRKLDNKADTFDQGTYDQTVTVRAGDGSRSIDLPYGIYAIRETGMSSDYSFHTFASGAGVVYDPTENFARFSFPRSLLDEGSNPANEWQVTVTAENRVHRDDQDDDDDDDDSYRSDGTTEGGGGGGGNAPGRSLFNHDDLVNIPEEAVPLSDKPLVEIPDEDVPLGALPNTGGFSMGVFAVIGAAITAIGVFLRKGKKSKA